MQLTIHTNEEVEHLLIMQLPESIRSLFAYRGIVFVLSKKLKDVTNGLCLVGLEADRYIHIPENILRVNRLQSIIPCHRVRARLERSSPLLIIFLYFLTLQELHWVGSRKASIVAFKVVINPPSVR